MKKLIWFYRLLFILPTAFFLNACEKTNICDETTGTVTVSNKSVSNTTLNVLIDGSVRVSLYPQTSQDIILPIGKFTLLFKSANGTGGCNPAAVTVTACSSQTFTCSY